MTEIPTPSDDLNRHFLVNLRNDRAEVIVTKQSVSSTTGETAFSRIEYNIADRTYRVVADADDEHGLDDKPLTEAIYTAVEGSSIHIDIFNFVVDQLQQNG